MFLSSEYELLDFGGGVQARTVWTGDSRPAAGRLWPQNSIAKALAHRPRKFKSGNQQRPRQPVVNGSPAIAYQNRALSHDNSQFELKLTEFGHVGVFRSKRQIGTGLLPMQSLHSPEIRVLNLFAYTGGSTLAVAGAGAMVTHVDAARNIVGWRGEMPSFPAFQVHQRHGLSTMH